MKSKSLVLIQQNFFFGLIVLNAVLKFWHDQSLKSYSD